MEFVVRVGISVLNTQPLYTFYGAGWGTTIDPYDTGTVTDIYDGEVYVEFEGPTSEMLSVSCPIDEFYDWFELDAD